MANERIRGAYDLTGDIAEEHLFLQTTKVVIASYRLKYIREPSLVDNYPTLSFVLMLLGSLYTYRDPSKPIYEPDNLLSCSIVRQ
jgi:hypothetical protein